jgi:osmoprotectant transport system substrate-binding protein
MKISRMRVLALLLVTALFAVVAGCGGDDNSSSSSGGGGGGGGSSSSSDQPGKGKPAVTIGTKDFTEEFILGELYKQALEAKGYSVSLKKNIGATEITDKAMTSGTIDGYPEYSGESTATVFGIDKIYDSPEATVADAKKHYEERGQVVSNPTPFEDVDAIATTKAFAEKNGLASMEDLKKLTPSFTLGARPEFKNRQVGLKGMEEVYGIKNAEFKQLALGLQYTALDKGDVDSANIFSTDAQLASGKYTVLKDPKGVFGFQNVLFVINKPKYEALGGATFMDIINKVNSLLTAEAMRSMNSAVDIDKKDPADVAKAFLDANKLT